MALTDDLKAWWDWEEASGPYADSVNSYEWGSTVANAPGKVGNAADFSPNYNAVTVQEPPFYFETQPFTTAAWIWHKDNTSTLGRIAAKNFNTKFKMQWSLRLTLNANGVLFELKTHRGGFTFDTVQKSGYTKQAWHLVVVYWDPSVPEIGISVNNSPYETAPASSSLASHTFGPELKIVNAAALVDSLGLWHRPLTQSEVGGLWNGGAGVEYSDVQGSGSTGTTYTVSGTVTDSGGSAIQGATVSLENVTGAAQSTDTTDASGAYSFSVTLDDADLPDTWDVVASASGYADQLKQVSASTSSTSYTTDFSLSPKYTFTPDSLSQTHALGGGGVNVAYALTPNALGHVHALEGTAISSGVTLSPSDVQHGHGIDLCSLGVGYTLSPNDAAHVHTIDTGGVNVAYTLAPNALQQGHTLGASALSTGVVLMPNDVQHGHTLDVSGVGVAFTLSPNNAAHGHTLDAGGLNVAYLLTPNALAHMHTLDGTAIGTGVVLAPNDVQHGHGIDPSSVAVAFTVSPNDSTQGQTLTGSDLNVVYALTPNELQQGHTLASTGLDYGLVLSPNDVSHSQTFDPSGVSVAFTLTPNDATQGHSIAGGSVAVAYALTPNGVQHAHSIGEAGASVAYTLSPNGLLHPQSVGVSGVSVAYALSPNDTQHEHLLGPLVLIVKGNAECASLEATPIYQIGLSAKPSPELNVTLSATPIIKKN